MRTELEAIYTRLYETYEFPLSSLPNSNDIVKTIKDEITNFESQSSNPLVKVRADTKLFFLVTFHQMVGVPVAEENFNSNRQLVSTYIREDVNRLMRLAFEQKINQNDKEITAHTILSLLDSEWDSLNISLRALWNK